MHPDHFLNKIDHDKVVAAIAAAEKLTSGEIRVWISQQKITDAVEAAQKRFLKLGMDKTPERNAVMIFVAPHTQVFAVIGDSGVHEKCGDAFWTTVSSQLSTDLKNASVTEAMINAIRKIGGLLAEHFPPGAERRNDLPDDIVGD